MKKMIGLFPGQGSQSVGMGQDLYNEFSTYREAFEESSHILNIDMKKLCFEDPLSQLNLTQFTQAALLTTSIATYRTLYKETKLSPTVVAGHSLGEYSALCALGALSFADALKAVYFRGLAMQRAVPLGVGAMAAFLGQETMLVEELCKEISNSDNIVEVVNFNCPGQIVLSGHKVAVEKICEVIKEKKLGKCISLNVSAPFHSSLMQPAANEMKEYLKDVEFHSFQNSIIANIDAKLYSNKTYTKDILVKQLASPVLWTQSLKKCEENFSDGVFIEIGNGKVLQGLLKKTLPHISCYGTQNVENLNQVIEIFNRPLV